MKILSVLGTLAAAVLSALLAFGTLCLAITGPKILTIPAGLAAAGVYRAGVQRIRPDEPLWRPVLRQLGCALLQCAALIVTVSLVLRGLDSTVGHPSGLAGVLILFPYLAPLMIFVAGRLFAFLHWLWRRTRPDNSITKAE